MFAAELALHAVVFAVVVAAKNVRRQTMAAMHVLLRASETPMRRLLATRRALHIRVSTDRLSAFQHSTVPMERLKFYMTPEDTSGRLVLSTPGNAGTMCPLICDNYYTLPVWLISPVSSYGVRSIALPFLPWAKHATASVLKEPLL